LFGNPASFCSSMAPQKSISALPVLAGRRQYVQLDNQGLISKFFGEIVHRTDGSCAKHDLVTILQDVSS
jgi:hypothetical protein